MTRRLYLGPAAEVFCVLDDQDYAWASRWNWNFVFNRSGKKMYAARSTRLHGRKGKQTRLYLHKEILKRTGQAPPSKKHHIGDHLDGDSLNNRRANLIWATVQENNRNRFGARARQGEFEEQQGASDVPF
jgi:hypothetical protein